MRKLYDFFLEMTSVPWSEYSSQHQSCGDRVQEIFHSSIYPLISAELLIITVIFLSIYYLYLNNRFGRYYSNKAWLVSMALSALIVSVATFFSARSALNGVSCPVSSQLIWISIINLLFASILFFALSFVFRLLSVMGRQTPHFSTN